MSQFTAEVTIRTVSFEADNPFLARAQVAEAFRHLLQPKDGDSIGQVIEIQLFEVEDTD